MDLEVARASAGQASDALASGAGGGLDRSLSDLQQMINQSNLDGVIAEIAEILKSSSEFEHRVSVYGGRRTHTFGAGQKTGCCGRLEPPTELLNTVRPSEQSADTAKKRRVLVMGWVWKLGNGGDVHLFAVLPNTNPPMGSRCPPALCSSRPCSGVFAQAAASQTTARPPGQA